MCCLQHELQRVLNNLLELLDPFTTNGAIDHLVIEATGDNDLVVPLGNSALLSLDGDSDLAGSANSQDTGLWGVDDSGEAFNSGVHAHVGDSESTALVLLGLQLVLTGTFAKILDLLGDAGKSKAINVLDDGGDQTRGGRHSNADIGGVVLADHGLAVLLAPAGVDLGDLQEGNGAGLDQEIVDGKLVLTLSGRVQSLAELQKLGDRKSSGDKVVGVLSHRLLETVGDGLAHRANRNLLIGRLSSESRGSRLGLLDILLCDNTTTTSALQALDGDTLLEGQELSSGADGGLTVKTGLELLVRGLRLLRSGGLLSRSWGRRLGALGLLLLLGGGRLITTSIGQGERLEGRDISTFLNKDGNRL